MVLGYAACSRLQSHYVLDFELYVETNGEARIVHTRDVHFPPQLRHIGPNVFFCTNRFEHLLRSQCKLRTKGAYGVLAASEAAAGSGRSQSRGPTRHPTGARLAHQAAAA